MSPRTSSRVVSIILSVTSLLYIGKSEDINNARCHSSSINTFNCSGVGLADLPDSSAIDGNVETLDLSYNRISHVTFSNFSALGHSLETLNLSNNQISVLQDDAFKPLTILVSLDLSNNAIYGGSLSKVKFRFLSKLLYLNLEKNPLKIVKTDTFTFMELPAIKRLYLSHCEIRELEINSFDLPALEYLDLSWNQIQTFKADSFRMLPNLMTLDMSRNRIRVLNEVPYMPELVTWYLDSNGMEAIEIRAMVEDFADNLQNLYLRDNNILRFGVDSLPLELGELRVIDMSNNGLHCDCRMRWIKSTTSDFQQKNYTFMCGYPSSVRGRDLLTLAPEELNCGIPLAKILVIVILCTLSVLGVFVIAVFVSLRRRRRKRRKSSGGDHSEEYTAVYMRDDRDLITMSDNKQVIVNDKDTECNV